MLTRTNSAGVLIVRDRLRSHGAFMNPLIRLLPELCRWFCQAGPGLTVVGGTTALAMWLNSVTNLSAGAIALAGGLCFGNIHLIQKPTQIGLTFASRRLLRCGVVLLGLRLSISELRQSMNWLDVVAVIALVAFTFWGVGRICSFFGLSPDFGRLLGVGYAVCGVSAIAAVKPLTDSEEEEVAYAVGMVTLFGTLSMLSYPLFGAILDLGPELFGWWAGSAIHDVAQVVATATMRGDQALETAVIVKLGRVALLGPILVILSLRTRRSDSGNKAGVTRVVPLFVFGFVVAVLIRSLDLFPADLLDFLDTTRKALLTAAMVGVGALVKFRNLASMGGGPLKAGFLSWVLLAGIAFCVSGFVV